MRSNRIYFLMEHDDFSDKLLKRLEEKYDVDVFRTCEALLLAVQATLPIAVISTVNSQENFEMMKSLRGIPFKSQYLAGYTMELARQYSRYCCNVSSYEWMDEILNASFSFIDEKIINENLAKVRKENKETGNVPKEGYSCSNVRTKTKESNRFPAATACDVQTILKEAK